MAKKHGWEITLLVLGFISIVNLFLPIIDNVRISQGSVTALIVIGIIIYLLNRKYEC